MVTVAETSPCKQLEQRGCQMVKRVVQGDVTICRNKYEPAGISGAIRISPEDPETMGVAMKITNPSVNLCSLPEFTQEVNGEWEKVLVANREKFCPDSDAGDFVPLTEQCLKEMLDL